MVVAVGIVFRPMCHRTRGVPEVPAGHMALVITHSAAF